jgi:peptide alpha-N-acetyltransferase
VGDALLKTSDPLGEAARMLEPLLRHATEFEQTHLLAFDVYFRKGRLLLALRAVNAAIRLAP